MLMMVVKRMLIAVPSLIGVVIVTFLLTRALPGDPAAYFAGPAATKEAVEQIRKKLGFDRPLIEQFFHYTGDLAHGDFGTSLTTGQPVATEIRNRLPASAELTLLAKTLFNLDAVTRAIDTSYSPIPTIREFGNKIAADRARRELNPRRLYQLATEGSDLLAALPHRLDIITSRMASNDFTTRIDVPQLKLIIDGLQKVANRVFSGLVLAGLLVASAMLIPYRRSLATWGFVLAGAIALWMVLTILWTDRDKNR